MNIAVRIAASALLGVLLVGLLLFWPAGTFNYWQAWVLIAVFAVGTLIPSIYLAVIARDFCTMAVNSGVSTTLV